MGLSERVEIFSRAQAARDTAAREVAKEMKRLRITQAMLPNLQAIIHMENAEDNPSVWIETDVTVST